MHQLVAALMAGYSGFDLHDNLVWSYPHRAWIPGGTGGVRHLRLHGAGSPVQSEKDWIDRSFYTVKKNIKYVSDDEVRAYLIHHGAIPNDAQSRQADVFLVASAGLYFGVGDCDDHTIAHDTLNAIAGFRVGLECVATDTKEWEHVFALVGLPRDNPRAWFPLDTAAPNVNPRPVPGWQVNDCKGPPYDGRCATNRWQREVRL
jgi:hypothetical protein